MLTKGDKLKSSGVTGLSVEDNEGTLLTGGGSEPTNHTINDNTQHTFKFNTFYNTYNDIYNDMFNLN